MVTEEIIQRVQSLYSKGVQSDDSRLSSEHIYNILTSVRSFLLSNKLKSKNKVSDWNYQTIGCIEIIEVKGIDCPCLPDVGCRMFRSKHKLPTPITDYSRDTITTVATVDGSKVFNLTTINRKRFSKGKRFTAEKEDYFILNGFLYLSGKHFYPALLLIGLFEDPFKVEEFSQLCETGCESCGCTSPLDMEFPIDLDLIPALIDLTLKELQVFFSSVEDKSNNGADSLPQQSK